MTGNSNQTAIASAYGDPLIVGDNLTLVDVWSSLHASAEAWRKAAHDADQRRSIDASDLSVLKTLSSVKAERWAQFCLAVGWTVYGAVGLSWCQNSNITMVKDAWEQSGFVLTPEDNARRPARLINPEHILDEYLLSKLVMGGDNSNLQICIFIAASTSEIEVDLSLETLSTSAPQLADFLRDDLRKRSRLNAQDAQLITMFSGIIENDSIPYS